MSDVQSEIAPANHVPSSEKFAIHILFDFFCHFLLVRTVFECVVDDVFGLELDLGFHFRIADFDCPLFGSFVHTLYNFINSNFKLNRPSKVSQHRAVIYVFMHSRKCSVSSFGSRSSTTPQPVRVNC